MSRAYTKDIRVLAIDPSTRGFGFSVLEGPERLIDWGVKETKTDKKKRSLQLIAELMERYQPNVVVIEDYEVKGSRRCLRVEALIADISKLAAKNRVKVRSVSRIKVKQAFSESGASNKYEIAVAIARRFQELTPRLPRFRKPWMSEDYRMSIFDAVGLAVTYFHFENQGKLAAENASPQRFTQRRVWFRFVPRASLPPRDFSWTSNANPSGELSLCPRSTINDFRTVDSRHVTFR